MDMDGNLLLSVLGGLGRVEVSDDGLETYVKDDDCVGRRLRHSLDLPPSVFCYCLRLIMHAADPFGTPGPECLKDLQRFLRYDDDSTRDAFFVLGKAQTTRTHLIPLITRYAEDVDIVYNACKPFCFHLNSPAPLLHTVHEMVGRSEVDNVCVKRAVKVVTFLTMPAEPESRDFPAQVRGYEKHET